MTGAATPVAFDSSHSPRRAPWGLLLLCTGCAGTPNEALPPRDAPRSAAPRAERGAAQEPSTELVHLEPPEAGELCAPEPPGRGCRLSPFQGTCATWFSASESEFEQDLARGYLSLRTAGDRRRLSADPPRFPAHASIAVIGSGLSTVELKHLAVLLGHDETIDTHPPSTRIASMVGLGDPYFATAYRITREFSEQLASLAPEASIARWAKAWDESSRELVAPERFAFRSESGEDCRRLLERIVRVAKDAVDSGRELHLVQSLSHANPEPCGEGADCGGLPCGLASDEWEEPEAVCHMPEDLCLTSLDCDGGSCSYRAATQRFECTPDE